jgi:O-antigen ligase
LLYRAVLVGLPDPEQRRKALRFVLWASVPVALLGILQQLDVAGVRGMLTSVHGVDLNEDFSYSKLARATGPFPHWQVFGAYMLIVTLLALSLRLERADRVIGPVSGTALVGIGIAATLATLTVAPVLALSVGALVLGYWARRLTRIFLVFTVAGIAGALILGSQITSRYELQFAPQQETGRNPLVPQTIAYRWEHWTQDLLPGLNGRWLTGYGPDLPSNVSFRFTESLYVELLFRGGIVLIALFGFLWWALWSKAWRRSGSPVAEERAMSRVLVIVAASFLLLHVIEPYFITSGMPHLVWVLAALLMRQDQTADRARDTEVQPAGASP